METNRALWIRGICKRLFKCANEEIFLEATHSSQERLNDVQLWHAIEIIWIILRDTESNVPYSR